MLLFVIPISFEIFCNILNNIKLFFSKEGLIDSCHSFQAKASLVTPVLSLTTPSNLAAGGSFVSALPTGFATGNVIY